MNKERYCANSQCAQTLTKKSQKIYCSNNCAASYKKIRLIQSWLDGEWSGAKTSGELSRTIRSYLIKEAGYKCSICSWDKINPVTGQVPLDIDHIDGNSENNISSNLRVLCPNCHSLTPTYKALNKSGKGTRAYLKKYNRFDLVERKEKDLSKITCKCGQLKSRTAKQCKSCYGLTIKEILPYPSNADMISEIRRIGLTKYAQTLGRTSNGVKGYLKRQGYTNDDLRITRESKILICSVCGTQLSDREVKTSRKRCSEHPFILVQYPPMEELMIGIKEFGYNGYARKLGLKHGSSLRKHLKKHSSD